MNDSVDRQGSSREGGHGPDWGVIRCECGVLHLKLGTIRLELTPAEFRRLQLLVNRASWQYGLERRDDRSVHSDTVNPADVCH